MYKFPWEVLEGSKGNGDSWVEMCPWDVSSWENDNHNGKTSWSSTAKEGFRAMCLLVHNGCSCPSKDKYESAYEFSSNLVNFDINTKWKHGSVLIWSFGASVCACVCGRERERERNRWPFLQVEQEEVVMSKRVWVKCLLPWPILQHWSTCNSWEGISYHSHFSLPWNHQREEHLESLGSQVWKVLMELPHCPSL